MGALGRRGRAGTDRRGLRAGRAGLAVAVGRRRAGVVPTASPTAVPTRVGQRERPSASAAPAATPPTPEKELIVYNWDSYIGENTVAEFQDKYGIKVKYVRFTDAVTQMASLRKDGKGGGYDVTYPASTEIPGLVRDGVIQPLHLEWIPNIANLGADWQNPSYDPATSTRCRTTGGRPGSPGTRPRSRAT